MNFGFIGLGNMAQAIIKGMLNAERYNPSNILGYNRTFKKTQILMDSYAISGCQQMHELMDSDIIILGVQPQQLSTVFDELRGQLQPNQLVISLAAGKSIASIQEGLKHEQVCRVMPNINAIAGASTTGLAIAPQVTASMKQIAVQLFEAVGSVIDIPEEQFDIFSAIAGASPAFSYLYIDSLARAAVLEGMDKTLALEIAANAVLGSAKMVLESADHPWSLVDQVCSPGGTTIQGVTSLQNNHFASTIYEAVNAVIQKDRILK